MNKPFTLLAFVMVIAGCTDGPSDTQIEQTVLAQKEAFHDFLEISDVERLRKTHGEDGTLTLNLRYRVTFELDQSDANYSPYLSPEFDNPLNNPPYGKPLWNEGDSYYEDRTMVFVEEDDSWALIKDLGPTLTHETTILY